MISSYNQEVALIDNINNIVINTKSQLEFHR